MGDSNYRMPEGLLKTYVDLLNKAVASGWADARGKVNYITDLASLENYIETLKLSPDESRVLYHSYAPKFDMLGYLRLPKDVVKRLQSFTTPQELARDIRYQFDMGKIPKEVDEGEVLQYFSKQFGASAPIRQERADLQKRKTEWDALMQLASGAGLAPLRKETPPTIDAFPWLNRTPVPREKDIWDYQTPETLAEFIKARNQALMTDLANRQGGQERYSPARAQSNAALLAGQDRQWRGTPQQQAPPMPAIDFNAESYLAPYGKGDLADYIASQIGQVARETAPARAQWWKAKNWTPQGSPSLTDEIARITGERDYWGGVADNATNSPYSGGVYYGEGGLKGVGEFGRQGAEGNLASLMSDRGGAAPTMPWARQDAGEDPFLKKLKSRNWQAEYNALMPSQKGGSNAAYSPMVRLLRGR